MKAITSRSTLRACVKTSVVPSPINLGVEHIRYKVVGGSFLHILPWTNKQLSRTLWKSLFVSAKPFISRIFLQRSAIGRKALYVRKK
jgi:hypothetical protein